MGGFRARVVTKAVADVVSSVAEHQTLIWPSQVRLLYHPRVETPLQARKSLTPGPREAGVCRIGCSF